MSPATPAPPPPGVRPSERPEQPIELDARRLGRHAWRAIRRRCPNCGNRPVFITYFRMLPTCPQCGLRLERGEGDYFIGAYLLNLVAAELIFAGVFVAAVIATWPNPPWDLLQWVCVAGVILAPVMFYPFSKALWLAADLAFRPVTAEDIQQHG